MNVTNRADTPSSSSNSSTTNTTSSNSNRRRPANHHHHHHTHTHTHTPPSLLIASSSARKRMWNSNNRVSSYDVGPVVGIGTYGEVRCGRDVFTGKRVALKIVDESNFLEDAKQLVRSEIAMLKSLKHNNCIRLIEVKRNVPYEGEFCSICACTTFVSTPGKSECMNCQNHTGSQHSPKETRRVTILVQDLAAAGELFSVIMHCGPFEESFARYYFRQMVDGLDYLHSHGICHRDLKPENLVLDANFDLKIIDFGLSANFGATMARLYGGAGSQPYSAPEVYYNAELHNSRGYLGPPVDIWSAAVILFVMLTGRPPFVRPLLESVGPHRQCKHFIRLLNGQGYGDMSVQARVFLQKLFRLDPAQRPTIEEIRNDTWFRGVVPTESTIVKVMEEKAHSVWLSQDKPEMVEVLTKVRQDLVDTPLLKPVLLPSAMDPTNMTTTTAGSVNVFSLDALSLDGQPPESTTTNTAAHRTTAGGVGGGVGGDVGGGGVGGGSSALRSGSSDTSRDDNQKTVSVSRRARISDDHVSPRSSSLFGNSGGGGDGGTAGGDGGGGGNTSKKSATTTTTTTKTTTTQSKSSSFVAGGCEGGVDGGNSTQQRREEKDGPRPLSDTHERGVSFEMTRFTRLVPAQSVESTLAHLTTTIADAGLDIYPSAKELYVTGKYNGNSISCLIRILSTSSPDQVLDFQKMHGDTTAFHAFFLDVTRGLQ